MALSTGEINTAYQGIYRRSPTGAETSFHLANHSNFTAMMTWIKSQNYYVNQLVPLLRAYEVALNRKPDSAGLDYWANAMQGGTTLAAVYSAFAASSESTAIYNGSPPVDHFWRTLIAIATGMIASSADIAWYSSLGWSRPQSLQNLAEGSASIGRHGSAIDAWANTASWNPTDSGLYTGQLV